jgi:CheY-like chemotaxis protein
LRGAIVGGDRRPRDRVENSNVEESNQRRRRRILVVDDERLGRAAIAAELRDLGDVDVDEAAGGAEALRMLGARPYDVLVLDLLMPLIDGWVVLRTVRSKAGPNHKTPVYVITSDTSELARSKALSMGVVLFMTKPVAKSTLRAVLSGELKRIARREEEDEEKGRGARATTPRR